MIMVKNSKVAKALKVDGIVIYPFVLFSSPNPDQILIKHELVHVEQIKNLGILRFYSTYFKEYIRNRLKGQTHHQAYISISYEIEAYDKQNNV